MTKTRTKSTIYEEESSSLYDDMSLDLETLSDDELDTLLFDEEAERPKSVLNLPTMAGLSLILVGIAYILQKLGLWGAGIDLTVLASLLPWLAGIFIILLGFGVLSWRPNIKNKKKLKVEKKLAKQQMKLNKQLSKIDKSTMSLAGKRKLYKSSNKKIAGVCSGIGDYFGIDPTLVRIAFVVGTLATGGSFIVAYALLAFIMPDSAKKTMEERITIIRDS